MISWARGSELDRVDHARRADGWVAARWADRDARLLVLDDRGHFATDEEGTDLRFGPTAGDYDDQRHVLLGLADGTAVFAVTEPAAPSTDSDASGRHDLREVGGSLAELPLDIAAAAAAVLHWHRLEPRCPRCGGLTRVIHGGFARHCDPCDTDHFPRTDPAVIVAVLDADDRLLLGGQTAWGHRVSVLAGFVEAGESLEQTVHREIEEESGVRLADVAYFGSQPWPFPRSLMVGFFARATGTGIDVEADDLSHAAWYTRAGLTAALDADRLGLPGPSSIAYRMIRAWRSGTHPELAPAG